MMRAHWLPLSCLVLTLPAAAADVALVTQTSGSVTLADEPAPAAPFAFPAGTPLTLADGATAVVLHEGAATRLRGPRTVQLTDLPKPGAATSAQNRGALQAVLSRDVSFAKAGASRSAGLTLLRPVPGSTVLAPQGFTWQCRDCSKQSVEVYDFLGDRVAWKSRGNGFVAYDGDNLTAGPYLVRVGTAEFSFTIADGDRQERVKQARAAADEARDALERDGVTDIAALVSIPGGVYLRSGLPSEALWLVDAALAEHPDNLDLLALRAGYERQAGVARP